MALSDQLAKFCNGIAPLDCWVPFRARALTQMRSVNTINLGG
jgi:hypothetical protein